METPRAPAMWQKELREAVASLEEDFIVRAFLATLADEDEPALPRAGQCTVRGRCGTCWDDDEVLLLGCEHTYCRQCLRGQLEARWPPPRVTFGYLRCGSCRAELDHDGLRDQMEPHRELRREAVELAVQAFQLSGYHNDLSEELGHTAAGDEVRARAEEVMVVYKCTDCAKLYCGGRADCAAQQDVKPEELRCPNCQWAAEADAHDHRCMVHGHQYAVFKCDSCCAVATWNCTHRHYCDRCHEQAFVRKLYPCPGGDLCPLGVPHPPNVDTHFDHGRPDGPCRSFVLGCTVCLGVAEAVALDAIGSNHLNFSEHNRFGYPRRQWASYDTGAALLREAGEEEVRARLRARAAPHEGSAAECAERLLLVELDVSCCRELLAMKVASAENFRQRLAAVGLPTTGPVTALAARLLALRARTVEDVRRAEEDALRMRRRAAEERIRRDAEYMATQAADAAAERRGAFPAEALRDLRESARCRGALARCEHRRRLSLKRRRRAQEGSSRKGPVSQRGGKHKVPIVDLGCCGAGGPTLLP